MQLPLIEATLLGALQGITEFLPISSDGHLALAQLLLGNNADLTTTVVLHFGTLSATILLLRQRVWRAISEGLRGLSHPSLLKETPGGRDVLTIVAATVPTGVIGLLLRAPVESWSNSPTIVGACFLLSAIAVGSTYWAPRGDATNPSLLGAVLVGVVQGTAVLPGLSRSATTIAALLWLGIGAERAFELSFLMSLPAVAGAVVLEGRHAFGRDTPIAALALGTFVAFITGIGALFFLRRVLVKGKLALFAVYLVPLAIATLAWGYARP